MKTETQRPDALDMATLPLADRKYLEKEGFFFFSGIQAIVRMIFDKHRRDLRLGRRENATYISGYEGSPLGGLDIELARAARLFPRIGRIVHQPGLNEKLAMAAVYGSQFAGHVDGVWYGKAQGVKWIPDEGGLAAFSGTGEGSGAVILAGDDHQSKSSTFPGSSDLMLEDMFCPILFPSTIDEIIQLGLAAFELSRFSGLYVGLKLLTPLCDGAASIKVYPDREQITIPPPIHKTVFRKAVLAKQSLAIEQEIVEERLESALHFARHNSFNFIVDYKGPQEKRLGFVVAGKAYTDLLLALCDIGCSVDRDPLRMLKLGMIYPVEPTIVREFARGLTDIVVIEEKRDFIEKQIKSILYGNSNARIWGKQDPEGRTLLPAHGEITPEVLVEKLYSLLREYLGPDRPFLESRRREIVEVLEHEGARATAARLPSYCSGCPHSRSLKLPEGSRAGGDIGCHTMEIMKEEPGRGIEWISSMGTGGGVNNGVFPFADNRHIFQNLGDGTYFHSGRLAIAASVAAGANITYKILYNGVVAMTGGQSPPGQLPIDRLVDELMSVGVKRAIVVSDRLKSSGSVRVEPHSAYSRVLEEIRGVAGTTAIIFDLECATERRRTVSRSGEPRTEFIVINEEVCEGCGDCGRSLCPSLYISETELGDKTSVHRSSCNDDLHCLIGDCPAFMRVKTRGGGEGRAEALADLVDPESIPLPTEAPHSVGNYNIVLAGIGGTGIVSLSALLAQATILEGGFVNELNMTGLAQKGGPVESQIVINMSEQPIINAVGYRRADLYLACDSVHGLAPENLRYIAYETTRIVANLTLIPTIEMIVDRLKSRPDREGLENAWRDLVVDGAAVLVDAGTIVEGLFANHMFTNIFLLGVAFQSGSIPLSLGSLKTAIVQHLRQPEKNLSSFHLGRLWVEDAEEVEMILRSERGEASRSILTRSLERHRSALSRGLGDLGKDLTRISGFEERACDLIDYQGIAYSRRYAELVARVVEADGEPEKRLSVAVARNMYKLMTYKDEYEVARLHLFGMNEGSLARDFGKAHRLAIYLLPPLLRELGLQRKLQIPAWLARPVFRSLVGLRRLRGTSFDPFAWPRVRRLERGLIRWYEEEINRVLGSLSDGEYEEALRVAELPDRIRGYESVKIRTASRLDNDALSGVLHGLGVEPHPERAASNLSGVVIGREQVRSRQT
ncbi:MAG: 2-oxoacid ferredoxin oxidoreductase [Gemmatimonadetes bacterium]|nr:2-oxoacid ferredoxin oxidoreductase [Gemmatimonadota bacterium]